MKPASQINRLHQSNPVSDFFFFRIKKSAICTAIIGANTEPIRYSRSFTVDYRRLR